MCLTTQSKRWGKLLAQKKRKDEYEKRKHCLKNDVFH